VHQDRCHQLAESNDEEEPTHQQPFFEVGRQDGKVQARREREEQGNGAD
jgi:hypothetical protein